MRTGLATTAAVVVLAAGIADITAHGQSSPPGPPDAATQRQAPDRQPVTERQTVPVFESGVDLVTLDVSVVEESGRPVRGLGPDDFVLKVDGASRRVGSVQFIQQNAAAGPPASSQYSSNEGAAGGRLIMLVVDQGNIRQGGGQTFIRAAERLFSDLGPGDRVGLAAIPGGQMVDFTAHVELVRQSIGLLTGGAPQFTRSRMGSRVGIAHAVALERGDTDALREPMERECGTTTNAQARQQCIADLQSEALELGSHVRQQTASSLLALRQLMTRLAATPRPKTLVMLTEGLILGRALEDISWVGPLASRAKISLYAIHIDDAYAEINTSMSRASASQFEDRRLRADGLHLLVGQARGTVLSAVASGDNAFARLSLELTGHYLLGFEPTAAERDGKPHQVSIQVKRRGVDVRARREFVIEPSARERSAEVALADALRDPLLSTDVALRVATYNVPDPASNKVLVFLTARLGGRDTDEPVQSVAYAVTNRRGELVASRVDLVDTFAGDRYQTTLALDPGMYTLKLAAVDGEGDLGSVEHSVTARYEAAGPFSVGDLMLTDVDAHRAGKLRPAIEPEIRADAVGAYLELLARDASPFADTSATLEIAVGADAPALATAPLTLTETRHAARRVAEGEVSLAALAPGGYVARAVVTAKGRVVARVLRPLTFDPTSETRVRIMSAAAPAGGRTGPALFQRTDVLQPAVVEYFLKETTPGAGSPGLAGALAVAREGRFSELPDRIDASAATDDPTPAFLRGLGLYARGELEPAAAEFRRSLRASSEFVAAAFYLGACYAAGGRDREAVGAWQTTLAAEGEAPFVYALAADAYLRLKDWASALDLAREGLERWPDDDEVRLRVVQALMGGGRAGEALAALDPYLDRHRDEHGMLLLAMRLLYESGSTAPERADADRRRFEEYLKAYRAADGPQQALAAEWLKVIESRARR